MTEAGPASLRPVENLHSNTSNSYQDHKHLSLKTIEGFRLRSVFFGDNPSEKKTMRGKDYGSLPPPSPSHKSANNQ